MDTLAMARRDRESQGPYEVEISYGGELDLHRSFIFCNKNAGHRKFIPIDQFNVDHLPLLYHDEDVVDAVRTLADLTVRVTVKYVSERRPKTFPGCDKPYPCYNDRGDDMMRVGSGWVKDVEIHKQKSSRKVTCECKECANSPTPKTDFAVIRIMTAAHVIYDDLEGEHTICHLFFDKGDSPEECSSALTLSGMVYVYSDIENDSSEMTYITHDLILADRLQQLWCRYKDAHMKVGNKYQSEWTDSRGRHLALSEYKDDPDRPLTIIVSHPHGCSKQVSVGLYTNRNVVCDVHSQFIYTTATCPGSSGAPVYVVERLCLGCSHPHCGNCDENKQLNFSVAMEF